MSKQLTKTITLNRVEIKCKCWKDLNKPIEDIIELNSGLYAIVEGFDYSYLCFLCNVNDREALNYKPLTQ